jgi:hypothetical protein
MDSERQTITRRRIQLGSGLDLRKLADSIEHISQSSESMALICDSVQFADAWVHLLRGQQASWPHKSDETAWLLTVGYTQEDPPLRALELVGCHMPPGSRLLAWERGLYARLALPHTSASSEIALMIERIMLGLHGLTSESDVELALESQQ